MDGQIRLKHKQTEQECAFDDKEQADNFLANTDDAAQWASSSIDAQAETPAATEQASEPAPAAKAKRK